MLAATCLSTLVVNANTSAVSILLPSISEDTGMSVDDLQWAVTGYSLVGAAVIITSGSLGDVFGRKRVFQLGLLLFVALLRADRARRDRRHGDRRPGDPGRRRRDDPGLWPEPALGGDLRRRNSCRSVSLWGAAAAVGAAAGPLLGGLLVGITGWQGLFWIDAGVAVVCMALTYVTVQESSDPNRPRSIDYLGTVLIALTLVPLIYGVHARAATGAGSPRARWAASRPRSSPGYLFVVVEKRVAVPLLDLALLRNRILVGSTLAILIGAGTINGLMYLLSLYFQNPAALDFSALEAGLATLPATVGLVRGRAVRARSWRNKFGGRQVIGIGFIAMAAGLRRHRSRRRRPGPTPTFLLPVLAIAVGMGLSNGPASSAATACVPPGAGRRGVRRLQHGAVRRRRGRDRAVRHDLQQRPGQPARRRRERRRTRWRPVWPPRPG